MPNTTTTTRPTSKQPTIGDLLAAFDQRFADLVAAGVRSEATRTMHRWHRRWVLSHLNACTPLASIDETVLDDLARVGGRYAAVPSRSITHATMAKRFATLRSAFKLARRLRWIDRVPEFPTFERRYRPLRHHLRDVGELARLCAELPPDRVAWVLLAVFTGQHASDVDRMQAYVDADPFGRPAWIQIRNTKNRREPRVVVMPSPLARFLRMRFRDLELRPGDPIAPPWPTGARCPALRRAGERAGLSSRITANTLRHTCGTWAVHVLRSVTKGASEWLGHASTATTDLIYAHALPPALAEVSAALSTFGRRLPPMKVLSAGDGRSSERRRPRRALAAPAVARKPTPEAHLRGRKNQV